MAASKLVHLAAALVVALVATFQAAAKHTGGVAPLPLPSKYRLLTAYYKRIRNQQQLVCADTDQQPGCMAKCDARCPNQCIVICPGCKTYCICDLYPGMSCGDPRFTGGDGNTFYFHGARDRDFCIVSDAHLHVNAHFVGNHNPELKRDFTWVQALGVTFGSAAHRLYVGARKTARWDSDVDRLEMTLDGDRIDHDIPARAGAAWESAAVPGLTVTRTAATNGVRVQLRGVLDIMANVVPVTEEDSRVHGYGLTADDSLAHLDLGFRFHGLTDDVHGVLGQTYRPDYVNRLSLSSRIPVMGGAPHYVSSDIFATDCAVARFGSRQPAGIVSMVTATDHV